MLMQSTFQLHCSTWNFILFFPFGFLGSFLNSTQSSSFHFIERTQPFSNYQRKSMVSKTIYEVKSMKLTAVGGGRRTAGGAYCEVLRKKGSRSHRHC
ncbi:hypothetical protein IC575_005477 [Cucumis melo]